MFWVSTSPPATLTSRLCVIYNASGYATTFFREQTSSWLRYRIFLRGKDLWTETKKRRRLVVRTVKGSVRSIRRHDVVRYVLQMGAANWSIVIYLHMHYHSASFQLVHMGLRRLKIMNVVSKLVFIFT